jgi:DNA-3-methyladenine glycosylase II
VVERFEVRPRGPYALAASVRFLEGFAPAAYDGATPGHLHLAFIADGSAAVAGVCVRAEGGVVVGETVGEADPGVVRAQVARILSLDVDGSGFPTVGERDPVIARLQAHYPGLRPVLFYSPYEAAAWALIGQRIRITQAARIKARMAEELGPAVTVHGERLHAFPDPARLADLDAVPGLPTQKVERLHALGRAATDGMLDAVGLRALPPAEALARLKELPGIGDFSAQLILLRGAGEPDYLPTAEPRLGRAVARAYGLDHPPSATDLTALAAAWRPYRTWATVLLRAMLEDETHEIVSGGRRARGTETEE